MCSVIFFFFQAEDGIRVLTVTGVQTCALPIWSPRGPVVETLLERGFHVFAINPKQLDRFRDRHSPAGAKDDRRGRFVLADSLRTHPPAFRPVHADDPLAIQLPELARAGEALQTEVRRLSH